MDHKTELTRILSELRSDLESCRKELRSYPKGQLMLMKTHGMLQKVQITKNPDGDLIRKGITRKPFLVHQLARKQYLKALTERQRYNIKLLHDTVCMLQGMELQDIISDLPSHYDRLPKELLLNEASKRRTAGPNPDESIPLQPAVLCIDDRTPRSWGSDPYRPNMSFSEQKCIRMTNGLLVRSKSEASILELYDRYGIPYHYDEVLSFHNLYYRANIHQAQDMAKEMHQGSAHRDNNASINLILSPDIIASDKNGKIIYHEHFGRVNDPEYLSSMQLKLQIYAACGIVPWNNLIITYDRTDGGIDLKLAETQIASKGLI